MVPRNGPSLYEPVRPEIRMDEGLDGTVCNSSRPNCVESACL
jgi:hypothetical protein